MPRSKLIVIAGPSGCGKTTIAKAILQNCSDIVFSVSATTRIKRNVEIDGRDYFFISREEFEEKIRRDELIEWEQIYGDYYGSLKREVDNAFRAGKSILFDVDVMGALSVKKKYPADAVSLFIKPPSLELLMERLKNRHTETPESFARRLERVTMEMNLADDFDYCVVNDDLDSAIASVDAIIKAVILTSSDAV